MNRAFGLEDKSLFQRMFQFYNTTETLRLGILNTAKVVLVTAQTKEIFFIFYPWQFNPALE